MKQLTYGHLYAFLRKHESDIRGPDPHFWTKRFLSEHHIRHDRILEILAGFGGYDDEEVLWNVVNRVPDSKGLLEDVETPVEYAIRKELYVFNGSSWGEPDINSALEMIMLEEGTDG